MTLKNNDDALLWQGLRKSDRAAFSEIFHRYVRLLYQYGYRMTANAVLTEDCIQDIFAELWQKRVKLGPTTSVKCYLISCLRRRLLRCQQREQRYASDWREDLKAEDTQEEQMIHEQTVVEQRHRLQLAVKKLTTRQQEAVCLKFYGQLSYEEIAVVMDISKASVYNLMSQAIVRLQKEMVTAPRMVSFFLAILAIIM